MSLQSCMRRIEVLRKKLDMGPKMWCFALLGDKEIPPETMALIGPQDTIYIKRIVLAHEDYL